MFDNNKIKKETGIIGSSILMEEILEMIIQISPIDISVLITGESGTGKELIAKAIHRYSNRYSKSLVAYGKQWSVEELNGFLLKPAKWIKGNKMGFAGLKKEEDRASVILYLNANGDEPITLP